MLTRDGKTEGQDATRRAETQKRGDLGLTNLELGIRWTCRSQTLLSSTTTTSITPCITPTPREKEEEKGAELRPKASTMEYYDLTDPGVQAILKA